MPVDRVGSTKELKKYSDASERTGKKLKKLELKLDGLPDKSLQHLLNVLGTCKLTKVRLHDCFKNADTFKTVLRAIRDNPYSDKNSISLDVRYNDGFDKGCVKVINDIINKELLSSLMLPKYANEKLHNLLRCIVNAPGQIKHMDFSINRLDDTCIKLLKIAIQQKKITRSLDLKECMGTFGILNKDDLTYLKRAHAKNKTLSIEWFCTGDIVKSSTSRVGFLTQVWNFKAGLNTTLKQIPVAEKANVTIEYFKAIESVTKAVMNMVSRKKGSKEEVFDSDSPMDDDDLMVMSDSEDSDSELRNAQASCSQSRKYFQAMDQYQQVPYSPETLHSAQSPVSDHQRLRQPSTDYAEFPSTPHSTLNTDMNFYGEPMRGQSQYGQVPKLQQHVPPRAQYQVKQEQEDIRHTQRFPQERNCWKNRHSGPYKNPNEQR